MRKGGTESDLGEGLTVMESEAGYYLKMKTCPAFCNYPGKALFNT